MECFVPGRVLIAPAEEFVEEYERDIAEAAGAPFEIEYSIGDVLRSYDLRTDSADAGSKESVPLPRVARVPEGEENRVAERIRVSKHIKAACPDYLVHASANIQIDDKGLGAAIAHIHASPVNSNCGKDCKIAILDTGVDPSYLRHPNVLHAQQYDVANPTGLGTSPSDSSGHGTVVAAIINLVAPAAELVSIKCLADNGTISGVLAGLYIARAVGPCDLVNLSLSVSCDPTQCPVCQTVSQASTNAQQLQFFFSSFMQASPGTMLVAAAGNGYSHVCMPAVFAGILAIGDYDCSADFPSSNSNYVHVPPDRYFLAPGGRTSVSKNFGTKPYYRKPVAFAGTSFAAAMATGVAARHVCASKGNPCSGGSPTISQGSMFDYVRSELSASADTGWQGYDPQKHGQGLITL